MCLLKKVTVVTIVLSGLCTFGFASERGGSSVLTADQVANLSCWEAGELLRAKVELNHQLGNAYLQTYKSLGEVFSIWGAKLFKVTTAGEAIEMAIFFQESATATEKAIAQSSEVVGNLKLETDLLLNHVLNCLKK